MQQQVALSACMLTFSLHIISFSLMLFQQYKVSTSTENYWNKRYEQGGTSGQGSTGRLAIYKARIVNTFIRKHKLKSLVDLGCGDGAVASLIDIPEYHGVDISSAAINLCRQRFVADHSKHFYDYEDYERCPIKASVALSLDVIFHLVEDALYHSYMQLLFLSASQYCIVYSCNEPRLPTDHPHMNRRCFTDWIQQHAPYWRLRALKRNAFPYSRLCDQKASSISDFYFFEAVAVAHTQLP